MAERFTEQDTGPPGEMVFTYRWYREFLQELRANGYRFRPFSANLGYGDIVLRHDMDLSVDAAVTMAHIEADLGIEATYCVLLTSPLYNPQEATHRAALREIESLGHDVALHFSTHEYWPVDEPPATGDIEARVREEQSMLASIVSPSETVSFHRPPSWVLNCEFDGFRSTYESALLDEIGYVADSSQRWRTTPPDVDDFPDIAQVLTHPGLWGREDATFAERVEQAIEASCAHADRTTREQFIDGDTA
jgi:peptidoglycan/xylan/chitin deacetylase (PgdA/CDA1 family)